MNRARLLVFAGVGLALWPVWRWYVLRMSDGGDEPWGLLALAAAAGCGVVALRRKDVPMRIAASASLLCGYAASYHFLPPLLRAVLGLSALALLLGRGPGSAGGHGLLLLSLPVIATMQFSLGYPIRVLAAEVSRLCLRLCGYEITREGTVLHWAGDALLVDAPCSGVQMLWAGLFLACLLAAHHRLSARATAAAVGAATVVIVLANAARATALFFKEARIVAWPEWTHAGIGMLVFAGVAMAIIALVPRLAAGRGNLDESPVIEGPTSRQWKCLAAAMAVAALVPLAPLPQRAPTIHTHLPAWPAAFDGAPLHEIPLTAREQEFGAGFPGKVARFTDGQREFILRAVAAPTRKLHPSADCFRALGYRLTAEPVLRDAQGRRWSQFLATKDSARLRIRERITDPAGREWTDVSSWFWSALGARSSGPWLATTVVMDARNGSETGSGMWKRAGARSSEMALFHVWRREHRADHLRPNFVAFGVHVQAVVHENVRLREAVRAEHGRKDIDERQAGLFLAITRDQRVGRSDFFDLRPAFRIPRDGDVSDGRGGLRGADLGDECFEVREDLRG